MPVFKWQVTKISSNFKGVELKNKDTTIILSIAKTHSILSLLLQFIVKRLRRIQKQRRVTELIKLSNSFLLSTEDPAPTENSSWWPYLCLQKKHFTAWKKLLLTLLNDNIEFEGLNTEALLPYSLKSATTFKRFVNAPEEDVVKAARNALAGTPVLLWYYFNQKTIDKKHVPYVSCFDAGLLWENEVSIESWREYVKSTVSEAALGFFTNPLDLGTSTKWAPGMSTDALWTGEPPVRPGFFTPYLWSLLGEKEQTEVLNTTSKQQLVLVWHYWWAFVATLGLTRDTGLFVEKDEPALLNITQSQRRTPPGVYMFLPFQQIAGAAGKLFMQKVNLCVQYNNCWSPNSSNSPESVRTALMALQESSVVQGRKWGSTGYVWVPTNLFHSQKKLFNKLSSLRKRSVCPAWQSFLAAASNTYCNEDFQLSEEQKTVLASLFSSHASVLLGPGGSGKTTVTGLAGQGCILYFSAAPTLPATVNLHRAQHKNIPPASQTLPLLLAFQEEHSCSSCDPLVQAMIDYYHSKDSDLPTDSTEPPGSQTVAFLNTKAAHIRPVPRAHKKRKVSETPVMLTLDEMQMLSDSDGYQLLQSCSSLWKPNRLVHLVLMGDLHQTMPVSGTGRFLQACQAVLPVQKLNTTWRFKGISALETFSTLFSQSEKITVSPAVLKRTVWPVCTEEEIRKTLWKLITVSSSHGVFKPSALVFVSLRNTEANLANFWGYNREYLAQKKKLSLAWKDKMPLFLGLCVSSVQEEPWFDREKNVVWEDAWSQGCRGQEVRLVYKSKNNFQLRKRPPVGQQNLVPASRGTRGTIVALSLVRAISEQKEVFLKTEKVFSSTSEPFPSLPAKGKRFIRVLLYLQKETYCEVFIPCNYKTVWPQVWGNRTSKSKHGVVLGYASGLPCLTGLQFDQVVALMPPTKCPLLLYARQAFYTMITRAKKSFRSFKFPRSNHSAPFSESSLCRDPDERVAPNRATEAQCRQEMTAYHAGARKMHSLVEEWASGTLID